MLYGLLALTVLYPAGATIVAFFGYRFVLFSYPTFAVVTAVLSLGTVIADLIVKGTKPDKVLRILLVLISPLSLINAWFFIVTCPQILVIVCVACSTCCSFYFSARYGRPLILSILIMTLSVLMILPISYLSFFVYLFGNFGENTVVKTLESPSGEYYAQIIDSDQGALGGNTFVDVYQKPVINAIIFRIEKDSQRVYSGKWREFEDMQIFWKSDDCLIINAAEYPLE